MAKEMRALFQSSPRAPVWVALGMLLPACTNGTVPLVLLGVAGSASERASETQRARDAGAGGTGNSGGAGGALAAEQRAGAEAAGPRLPPSPCDAPWEPELEDALREAINDAITQERLCPRGSTGLRRPLTEDEELTRQTHAAICSGVPGRGTWVRVPWTGALGWLLSDTPSLEDAKSALLNSDDRAMLCDEAQRTPFRSIGVGHAGGFWSVLISPGPSPDMHGDDMQKP